MYGCQRTTLQCHFSSFTFTWVLGTKLKLLELQSRQVPLPVEPFRQPRTKDLVASYMLIRHVHRMFYSLCTICTGLFYLHFQETGEQLTGKTQYSTHQPPWDQSDQSWAHNPVFISKSGFKLILNPFREESGAVFLLKWKLRAFSLGACVNRTATMWNIGMEPTQKRTDLSNTRNKQNQWTFYFGHILSPRSA